MNKLFKISSLSFFTAGCFAAVACTCSCNQTSLADEINQLRKELQETKEKQKEKILKSISETVNSEEIKKGIADNLRKKGTDLKKTIIKNVKTILNEKNINNQTIIEKEIGDFLDNDWDKVQTNVADSVEKILRDQKVIESKVKEYLIARDNSSIDVVRREIRNVLYNTSPKDYNGVPGIKTLVIQEINAAFDHRYVNFQLLMTEKIIKFLNAQNEFVEFTVIQEIKEILSKPSDDLKNSVIQEINSILKGKDKNTLIKNTIKERIDNTLKDTNIIQEIFDSLVIEKVGNALKDQTPIENEIIKKIDNVLDSKTENVTNQINRRIRDLVIDKGNLALKAYADKKVNERIVKMKSKTMSIMEEKQKNKDKMTYDELASLLETIFDQNK